MKYAVTFQQKYAREDHPDCKVIDNHAYLTVEADDELEARFKVMKLIGRDWAFMYRWKEFTPQIEKYDLWDVTGHFDRMHKEK